MPTLSLTLGGAPAKTNRSVAFFPGGFYTLPMQGKVARPVTSAPKQARARATRDRIFAVAGDIFAAQGFAGARVGEIAQRAGVNRQRLYAYFGSKRELYRQVLIDVYAQVANHEGLLSLSVDDLPVMTGRIVDRFFEIHEGNPRFWRLLCWENLNGGQSLRPADWERLRGAYITHLGQLYAEGQRRGQFRRDVDFTTYLLVLFSTTYFYFSNQMTISRLLGVALDSRAVRRQIEEQFVAVMDRGLAGKSTAG